jgi:phage terminase large subunit-like protein
VDRAIKCELVTATKNKKIRAQPIQALYEEGMVHHVGHFPELELEMTTWVYDTGMDSPNRMDALVWGCTWFVKEDVTECWSQDF